MKRIVKALGNAVGLYAVMAIALPAQTFTTLHSFEFTDGANPLGALSQATGGDLNGVTADNGTNGQGTVFKITPGGTLTTLYNFCSQAVVHHGGERCGDALCIQHQGLDQHGVG